MPRITGPLLACALALANASANAQAGATPAPPEGRDASTAGEPRGGSAQPPTADDICRALEQSAAENALPVEFFAPRDLAGKSLRCAGCQPQGSRRYRPIYAEHRQLARPRRPVRSDGEALRHSAAYLRELLSHFGNLELAAAAYNAGPARVSGMAGKPPFPTERNAQLCGPCDRLDCRRMGVIHAARKSRDHHSTRRALHPASQSDPCTEAREDSALPPTSRAGAFNWQRICLRARLGQSIVTD